MNGQEAIKQAEATHSEMVGRLLSARASLAEGDARRNGLALAIETGDADARREAATLAKTADGLAERIRNLTHAVQQAALAVTQARQDADLAVKREAAAQARIISTRLAARGAALDAALDQVREGFQAFQDDLRELSIVGAPAPSANLIEVNSRRTLDAALTGLHQKMRPVPPLQRHSFDELLRGWALPSARWAAQILDSPANEERAA